MPTTARAGLAGRKARARKNDGHAEDRHVQGAEQVQADTGVLRDQTHNDLADAGDHEQYDGHAGMPDRRPEMSQEQGADDEQGARPRPRMQA